MALTDAPGRPLYAEALLNASELLVLQLLALGYTPAQVALLLGVEADAVSRAADGAAARLGAPDWREAAAALVRRGVVHAAQAKK